MMGLVIGSLNYSSWSVRAWLALEHAGADFKSHEIGLFVDPDYREKILQFSGAGKVPVLVDASLSVHEALAICEYAAERFPGANLWPDDMQLRARARAVSSEMSSGFPNIRNEMPMNCRGRAKNFSPSDDTLQEIERVLDIWNASIATSPGPFLFGEFSIADCMYAPVVSRFRTYGVRLDGDLASWGERMWAHPALTKWEKLAADAAPIAKYDAYCE